MAARQLLRVCVLGAAVAPAAALGSTAGRSARLGAGQLGGLVRPLPEQRHRLGRRTVLDMARLAGAGALLQRALPAGADAPPAGAEAAAQPAPPPGPIEPPSLDMTLPYLNVEEPLSKLLGPRATLVVNIKLDDPNTGADLVQLEYLGRRLGSKGLRVIAVPTDQGWFEPDMSEQIRQKAKYSYDYGGSLDAIIVDKVNVEAPRQHPFYDYLVNALPTPSGGKRIGLNYEKFLLDSSGRPLRRYPRKYTVSSLAADIDAIVNVPGDKPSPDAQAKALPPETEAWKTAWVEASKEAKRSEYAFRPSGINRSYYTGFGTDSKAAPTDLKPK